MMFDPTIQALLDAVKAAYQQGGYLAVVGIGLMLSIRAFRLLGGEDLWAQLRPLYQKLIVFGNAAVGAAVLAYATGSPLTMAIPGAVVAGLTSILIHKGSQAAGAKVRLTGDPKVDAALKLALGDQLQEPK